ncbi:hypothetical protein MBRA1_003211 [Malassezia brasiliensis]|uniref:Uncharacterized protein n=1 Tax=Malassezia brasiliensis TaxID=1821822 RepID=A0AAF0DZT7_9BASI|nr:hypothetical protein MBRA1_003211 [Malassezia brasiliensis]
MPRGAPQRVGSRVSIPVNVPDDELDAYIAEMILAEAQAKEEAYARRGPAAEAFANTTARSAPPARTNKRFLATMIRSVDAHNQRQEANEAQASQRRAHARTADHRPGVRHARAGLDRFVQRALADRTGTHAGREASPERRTHAPTERMRTTSRSGRSPRRPYGYGI